MTKIRITKPGTGETNKRRYLVVLIIEYWNL
jgi:hypothetical protein